MATLAYCAIQSQDLIREIMKLTEIREMQVTITESVKAGLITGGITTLGALFAGPLGIPIGGLLGVSVASYFGKNKFKSATEIIMNDITDEQREKLAEALRKALTPQNIMTLAHLIMAIQNDQHVVNLVSNTVRSYLTQDLHLVVS